jgi:flagellar hook assembly protein FlgD
MSNLVSSVDPNSYYVPPAPKKLPGLDMNTFLHLLTVQMASQNPLEPMKDSDLYAQISQLGQVEGMQNLQAQGDFNKAQSLVGKEVSVVNPNATSKSNQIITGVVSAVMIAGDGSLKLNVVDAHGGSTAVELGAIQEILSSGDSGPTSIPADYAFLIGKQVSGLNGTTTISGQATGIAVVNGVIMVDVLNAAGVKLQLSVGNVTSIS